jgi:hypothetical protein
MGEKRTLMSQLSHTVLYVSLSYTVLSKGFFIGSHAKWKSQPIYVDDKRLRHNHYCHIFLGWPGYLKGTFTSCRGDSFHHHSRFKNWSMMRGLFYISTFCFRPWMDGVALTHLHCQAHNNVFCCSCPSVPGSRI